jgi:hypothetical protein
VKPEDRAKRLLKVRWRGRYAVDDDELIESAVARARADGVPEGKIDRLVTEAIRGPQDDVTVPALCGRLYHAAHEHNPTRPGRRDSPAGVLTLTLLRSAPGWLTSPQCTPRRSPRWRPRRDLDTRTSRAGGT